MNLHHLNLNLASAIWVTSGLVGLYHSLRIIPKYIFTRRVARRLAPEDRDIAQDFSWEFLVGECLRLTVHLLTVAVGIWSLFIAPQAVQPVPRGVALFGFAVLVTIIWANVATTANTINARRAYERRRKQPRTRRAKADVSRAALAVALMRIRRNARRPAPPGDRDTQDARQDARQDLRQDSRQDVRRDAWENERRDAP